MPDNGGHDPKTQRSASKGQYDPFALPDFDNDFIQSEELQAFADALAAPTAPILPSALNDWRPIYQKIKKVRKRPQRRDETREG